MEICEEKLNETFEWGSYAPYTREILPVAKAYTKDNLCLVLGAGVSVDSHVPQWNELISKLMIKVIQNRIMRDNFSEKQIEELSRLTLESQKASPLIQMRFINSALKISNNDFIDLIHETLYNNLVDYNTPILNSIKELCIGIQGCQEYSSAHIRKIITYNFDDVLEQLIKNNPIKLNVIFDKVGYMIQNV